MCEISFADRFAACQFARTKNQKRFSVLHAIDLTAQRLEKRGRANDGVLQPAGFELLLKTKLRALECEAGFLDTDGRKEGEVSDASVDCPLQNLVIDAVVDDLAVLDSATAACDAGNDRIDFSITDGLLKALLREVLYDDIGRRRECRFALLGAVLLLSLCVIKVMGDGG